jgi:plasmid stabilization system protein ParE
MGSITDHPDVRVLPVVRYPYLIFYRLIAEADEVRVLRIRHGRRKPLTPGEI